MTSSEWRAARFLHTRLLISELRFWVSVAGLNSDDRKLSSYLYFFYLLLIFGAWASLMLFYLSNMLVDITLPLQYFLSVSYIDLITSLGSFALFLWSMYYIFQSTRKCPIIFSEVDGYIECQTPIARGYIVFLRLIKQWTINVLPVMFVASAIGLSFLESRNMDGQTLFSFSEVLTASLRPWAFILPLHLSLFSLAWVVGVRRLRRDAHPNKLMNAIRIFIFSAVLLLIALVQKAILSPSPDCNIQLIVQILNPPLVAGFGGVNWVLWMTIYCFSLALIEFVLIKISADLNLSRAAQETYFLQFRRLALITGHTNEVQEIVDYQHLGSGHNPSRLPELPGRWAFLWKDAIEFIRKLSFSHLWLGLSMITLPSLFFLFAGTKIGTIFVFFWTAQVIQYTGERFRNDLGRWWITKSLPMSRRQLVLFNIAGPSIVMTLLTWIAYWTGVLLNISITPVFLVAAPVLVLGVSLFAVFDLLRQCRPGALANNRVPAISPVGLGLSLLWVVLYGGVFLYLSSLNLGLLYVLLTLLAGTGGLWLLLWLSEMHLKKL